MRTAEVIFGLLLVAAALALAFGAAGLIAPVPPAGLGMTLALTGLGSTIAAHGMAGRAHGRGFNAAAGRWRALFYALLAATYAATLPLAAEVLNLVSVGGFPLGFYFAAQGLMVVFAILAFRAAQHLDGLERDAEPPAEDT